jgi:Fe-S cluster biogenesis protein NfuA
MLNVARAEDLGTSVAEAPVAADPNRKSVRLVGLERRPAIARAASAPAPRPVRRLDTAERIAAIEGALAALRPRLKADGGDCELVDVVDDVVRVRLTGACVGCQLASMTVLGVRMRLIEALGFPIKVVPV